VLLSPSWPFRLDFTLRLVGLLKRNPLTAKRTFHLTKWYADCIGENGDTAIVYCGIARWRAIALHYASVLGAIAVNQPSTRYSLRKCAMPVEKGTTIRWQSKSLKTKGAWERLDPPCDVRIYESREGAIEWHCVHPRARATVDLGDGVVIEGLGYVERLEMTVAPWNLPLEELRWGRFLSNTDSVVWIDWRGEHARKIVLENGTLGVMSAIADSGIALEGNVRLRLSTGSVLRTGALGKTALGMIPGVNRLLPSRLLNAQECKLRSRGELLRGNVRSSGWAIHEVVRWPK